MSEVLERPATAGPGPVASGDLTVADLTAMLYRAERATRRALAAAKAMSLVSSVAGVTLIVPAANGVLGPSAAQRAFAFVVLAYVGGWLGVALGVLPWKQVSRLLDVADGAGDVRAVWPVVHYLSRQQWAPNRGARLRVLASLLSRLQPGDERLFTGDQRHAITKYCLRSAGDLSVRLAMLGALRHIADDRCLALAEASLIEDWVSPAERKHQDRLQEVLPELRARAPKVTASDRLLRPAEPPSESTLLRPAEGTPSGNEALLVRPVDAPAACGTVRDGDTEGSAPLEER